MFLLRPYALGNLSAGGALFKKHIDTEVTGIDFMDKRFTSQIILQVLQKKKGLM